MQKDTQAEAGSSALESERAKELFRPDGQTDATLVAHLARAVLTLPHGICDVRIGSRASERVGLEARVAVGRPSRAVVMFFKNEDEAYAKRCSVLLTCEGFRATTVAFASQSGRVEALPELYEALASAKVTADDVLVGIGDTKSLSMLLHVGSTWCGGMHTIVLPTTLDACLEVPATPSPLSVAALSPRIAVLARPHRCLCDFDSMADSFLRDDETVLHAYALLVAAAIGDSQTSVARLAAQAKDLCAKDSETLKQALVDALRARAACAGAASPTSHQALDYGMTFARGLAQLLPHTPWSRIRAEGLRFAARLAASRKDCDVELVFVQDALLADFGLDEVACTVDPVELVSAIRHQAHLRSNRCMFCLPLDFGRVRLTSVEEAHLMEHATAWCLARSRLDTEAKKTVAAHEGV